MKFTAAREALLKPLQAVIGVVERRQTMPILANVLLVAKDDQISVTATDLEVELVASTEAEIGGAGEITVAGRKLLDICRALPEQAEVAIQLSGEKLSIKSGRSKFSLTTLPAADVRILATSDDALLAASALAAESGVTPYSLGDLASRATSISSSVRSYSKSRASPTSVSMT